MGFWIFMLISTLMIPLGLWGIGLFFGKHPPTDINLVWGYRTGRSMKNQDTWELANRTFARIWIYGGPIAALLALVMLLPVVGKDEDMVATVGILAMIPAFAVIALSILVTESTLKKHFDKDGNPKK